MTALETQKKLVESKLIKEQRKRTKVSRIYIFNRILIMV